MDEWERKKEAGEPGTEQEQEEENIYAVTKEQEVRLTHENETYTTLWLYKATSVPLCLQLNGSQVL